MDGDLQPRPDRTAGGSQMPSTSERLQRFARENAAGRRWPSHELRCDQGWPRHHVAARARRRIRRRSSAQALPWPPSGSPAVVSRPSRWSGQRSASTTSARVPSPTCRPHFAACNSICRKPPWTRSPRDAGYRPEASCGPSGPGSASDPGRPHPRPQSCCRRWTNARRPTRCLSIMSCGRLPLTCAASTARFHPHRRPASSPGAVAGEARQGSDGGAARRVRSRSASLAGFCQLSVSHFTRAFGNTVGTPPYRWLLDRRLERAMALLSGAGLSLVEISLACGFANQSHFTRTFTRHIGVSPGEWRRQQARNALSPGLRYASAGSRQVGMVSGKTLRSDDD